MRNPKRSQVSIETQKQKAKQEKQKAKIEKQNKMELQKEKKQKLKDYKQFFEAGYCYSTKTDSKTRETKLTKEKFEGSDFQEYIKLLDELESKKEKKQKEAKMQKLSLYWGVRFSNDVSVKGVTFFNLRQYKESINQKISELEAKKRKYSQYKNLVQLINRQIQKNYFYLQTYAGQVFDLYFEADSLTKYNFDLLHFDLFLKDDNLNSQLLYYRLIDKKTRTPDFSTYILWNEYTKGVVFDKTESDIINRVTNDIIISEIAKHDSMKLEFLKTYVSQLYKNKKNQVTKNTIVRYKKYILDRYGYLL